MTDERRTFRILMLVHVVASSGGIEAALVDLAEALTAAGHHVRVFACQPFTQPNQNVDRLRLAGAELSACPSWLTTIAPVDEPGRVARAERLLLWLTPGLAPIALGDALIRRRSPARSLQGLRGKAQALILPRLALERLFYLPLASLVRRDRPDIVHVHGWGCGLDPPGALDWARSRGFPTVYTEHNSPQDAPDGALPPSWLNRADQVIACSQAGATGLRRVCRAQGPTTVIPYSVQDPSRGWSVVESATSAKRGITVTCLARLSIRHKGQDLLLRAMAKLLASVPEARLLMAGDGESRAELEGQARALGIAERVDFLGTVPRAGLAELMARTDIFVLPSRWEGLPVAIIEAMAFGKPVVASAAGGNPELVADGESGLIVPIDDVDALAEALARLASDPEMRATMGAAGRRRFEAGGFAPQAVAEATLAVYRQAMGQAAGA